MLLPMLSLSEHVMRCKVNDMRDISALEKVYTILSFPYFKISTQFARASE